MRAPTGRRRDVGLVVGLRALKLGDFCAAVPAWKALRRAFPGHRTVLAAPAWQGPLLELCPAIDELASTEPLGPLPPSVMGADLAVNLHGHGPTSTHSLVAIRPSRLVAFAHRDVPDVEGPAWHEQEHEVARWCRLLEHSGIAADAADLDLATPSVPAPVRGATIVHPGAASAARRWPLGRWAAVVKALARDGHDVVITGSEMERPLALALAEAAGLSTAHVLAGETDLLQLAALVCDARLVCCADTGVAHLASGYAVRSVVLFGPVPPAAWGPPQTGRHVALWRSVPGGRGDPHGLRLDPRLAQLGVSDVLDAVRVLSESARGTSPA